MGIKTTVIARHSSRDDALVRFRGPGSDRDAYRQIPARILPRKILLGMIVTRLYN